MCLPPSPELILKKEQLTSDKSKSEKLKYLNSISPLRLANELNHEYSLKNNGMEIKYKSEIKQKRKIVHNELLLKSLTNSFYKTKLDQSLLQVKALEELLQESKQRENELEEIIYNLKTVMDEILIRKNDNNSRRCSLSNINTLPSTMV